MDPVWTDFTYALRGLARRPGFTPVVVVTLANSIAVGMAGAVAGGRLLTSLLSGISPVDPLVFVTVPLVLGSAAFLACIVPAMRASFMGPLSVLRQE